MRDEEKFQGIVIMVANFLGEFFRGAILRVQIFYDATVWSRFF